MPKQVPMIPCIAESACTVATVILMCKAPMLREAKFVTVQPDAAGCKVGCRNLRSGTWSQSGEVIFVSYFLLEMQNA